MNERISINAFSKISNKNEPKTNIILTRITAIINKSINQFDHTYDERPPYFLASKLDLLLAMLLVIVA